MSRPDTNVLQQAIGRAIRRQRERAGMTQASLAEAIGRTAQYVSMLERGNSAASLDTLAALAATLAVPVGELVPNSPDQDDDAIIETVALLRSLGPQDRIRAHKALLAFFSAS